MLLLSIQTLMLGSLGLQVPGFGKGVREGVKDFAAVADISSTQVH